MKKLGWFVFFSIIAFSCLNEPDCYQLNNSSVVISFKILGAGVKQATIVDQYPVTGIQSPETDSVFYDYSYVSSVELPLNPLTEETSFSFQGVYGINAIQLGYNRQVQFVSEDCGDRYIFSELKALEYDFDSVRVVNPTPTAPASTNVEIFRCPRTNLVGVTFKNQVILDGVTADFPTFIFQENDSLTRIDLPINEDAATTTFVFDFRSTPSKTLKLSYTSATRTLSKICGEQTVFDDLAVASTDFSTVAIKNDSTQDLPIINFEITQ